MKGIAPELLDWMAVDPRFNTKLSPEQEQEYQAWKAKNAPGDSGYDYDLRGAFLDSMSPDPATKHWDDKYKKPNEPTFSTFSKYAAAEPKLAGTWEGDKFIPPSYTPQKTSPNVEEILSGLQGRPISTDEVAWRALGGRDGGGGGAQPELGTPPTKLLTGNQLLSAVPGLLAALEGLKGSK